MKLIYWRSQCLDDSDCYSIRRKTKKEVKAELKFRATRSIEFGPIEKVTMEYKDGFELMDACLCEDRGNYLEQRKEEEEDIVWCDL